MLVLLQAQQVCHSLTCWRVWEDTPVFGPLGGNSSEEVSVVVAVGEQQKGFAEPWAWQCWVRGPTPSLVARPLAAEP